MNRELKGATITPIPPVCRTDPTRSDPITDKQPRFIHAGDIGSDIEQLSAARQPLIAIGPAWLIMGGISGGLSLRLEAGGLLGATGRVAGRIRMGAGTGQLPAVDDQVLLANRPAVQPALEDFARARRIARLRGQ